MPQPENLVTGSVHHGTKRSIEVLTEQEVERLDNALRTSHHYRLGMRNRLALALMYGAGLRISEVLALGVADVDPVTGDIRVVRGKGNKDRSPKLPDKYLPLLHDWCSARPNGKTLVCRLDGGPLAASALRQTMKRAARRAGIHKEVRCHAFRHGFAIRMADANVPVPYIQSLLGHENLQTTQVYLSKLDSATKAREYVDKVFA